MSYNYDRTSAKRQARRRALFTRMQRALCAIERAESLEEAKEIARAAFRDEESSK